MNPLGSCQVTNCGKRRVEVVIIGARLYCLECAAPLVKKRPAPSPPQDVK